MFWIFSVSSTRPMRFRSCSASSSSVCAKRALSWFASSGVSCASTPRRLPSRVSLATRRMSWRDLPRKRSTALLRRGSSPGSFTFATPCTLGDTALRVGAAHRDVDVDVREVDAVHELEEGDAQGAPAAHHPIAHLLVAHLAYPAREDEGLVGSAHVEQTPHDHGEGHEDDERGLGEDEEDLHHRASSRRPMRARTSTPTARAVSAMTRATAAGKLATKAE